MYFPKPLQPGDTVALIDISSAVPDARLQPAIDAVKARGFVVRVYDSCKQKYFSFGGSDRQRAKDFEDAFCDDSIDGIFCIRGGYGAARALELVDWDKVRAAVQRKPKYFSGYSDVTAAHAALHQLCELVTWHTPMPSTEYYKPLDDFTERYLAASIAGEPVTEIVNPQGEAMISLVDGCACGQLVGGNLSLLAAAVGTPFDLNTKGKILLIEDVDEPPYRLDRMFIQLRQAGKFADAAGIILGAFTNCENGEDSDDMPLDAVIADIFGQMNKPVITNLRCGHCLPTVSLPLGAQVMMEHGKIYVKEFGGAR